MTGQLLFAGFPADSSWELSSAYATFNPSSVTFNSAGVPNHVEVTVAADAPSDYEASASPDAGGAVVVTTIHTPQPYIDSEFVADAIPPLHGACFAPGETVNLSTPSDGLTLAPSTVADMSGNISFAIAPTAQPQQTSITVVATSPISGRTASRTMDVAATSVLSGQRVTSGPFSVLASSDFHYLLVLSGCVLSLAHLLLVDGVEHDIGVWFAGGQVTEPCYIAMQPDGNFVLNTTADRLVWCTSTQGTGARNRFVVQTDGSLRIYNYYGYQVWSSLTGRSALGIGSTLRTGQTLINGNAALKIIDGNLIAYSEHKAIWSSHTTGSGGTVLSMQASGNAELRTVAGKVVWQSKTSRTGIANYLRLSPSGVIAVVTSLNRTVWQS